MSTARIWLAGAMAIAIAALVTLPGCAEPWEQGPREMRHEEHHRIRAEMDDLARRIEAEREQLARDEQRMEELRQMLHELREERREGWQRY